MRLLLRFLFWLVTVVLTLAGALFWRLTQGPLMLDFLKPRIEAELREAAPGLTLDIGDVSLVWDREAERIEICATNVRVSGIEAQDVTIPSMALRFEVAPLLRGEIEVEDIELIQPRLQLVRQEDGAIRFGMARDDGKVSANSVPFGPDSPLNRIGSFGIRDGVVSIDDLAAKRTWQVEKFGLRLRTHANGFEAETGAELWLEQFLGEQAKDVKAKVQVGGDIDLSTDVIEVKHASVETADVGIDAKARVQGLVAGEPSFDVDATVSAMAVDVLSRYWPQNAASEARSWVVNNVTSGKVGNATAHLSGGSTEKDGLKIDTLEGKAQYDGLSVRFVDTMPPATGVSGTARVTLASGGEFAVTSGRLLDIAITKATVLLPTGAEPSIVIDAQVQGRLTSAFNVLDKPPVRLRQLIGLGPRDGAFTGSVGFAFPLRDGLKYGDLGLKVATDVTGAAVDRLVGDWNLRGGDFAVSIQGPALLIEGGARLQDVPLRGKVSDTIGGRNGLRVEVSGDVDAAGFERLGFDVSPYVQGTTRVDAVLTQSGDGVQLVSVNADLQRTGLALPIAVLEKRPDSPGKGQVKLRFERGALTRFDGLEIGYGGNSFRASGSRLPHGAWRSINADLGVAPAQNGRAPGRVSLALSGSGVFQIESGDAGALISAFGVDRGEGGVFSLVGITDPQRLHPDFQGKVTLTDVTITRSPLLTNLLTLASLRGLLNLFMDKGMHFDRVSAEVALAGTRLTVREGAARGASLNLVVSGSVDFQADVLEIQGSAIPSYFGLNEGIGKVPILGTLLTGDEGRGVQSFDFTATGSLVDPKVKINPISSLTPNGFMSLFKKLESSIGYR